MRDDFIVRIMVEAPVIKCYKINGVWYRFFKFPNGDTRCYIWVKVDGEFQWKKLCEPIDFRWDEVTQVVEEDTFDRIVR